jgi:hypothetical protein
MNTPVDTTPSEPRPLGELIGEIAEDLSTLVRQEIELAKAEAKESAGKAGKGTGMFGGAGIAGWFVLLFLSIALWWLIGSGTGRGWAALIVAGIWAVIAAALAILGRNEFRSIRGLDRTAETVQKIPNALTGDEQENRP